MCNCNCFYWKSKASAETDSGNTFDLITPTDSITPSNTDKLSILITSLGNVSPTLPVYIALNGSNVPVLDKYGNIVYGNQLKTRLVLRGYYGTNGIGTVITHLQLVNFPYCG